MSKLTANEQKRKLRQALTQARDALTLQQREQKSGLIRRRFFEYAHAHEPTTFCVYAHYRSEVRTRELIEILLQRGGRVCMPVVVPAAKEIFPVQIESHQADLLPGFRNILEPRPALHEPAALDPGTIDMVIVPGLGFDRAGARLGYGGGYYDRFLQQRAPQAIRVGLAFALQIVEKINTEQHDIPMDAVICEQCIIRPGVYRQIKP